MGRWTGLSRSIFPAMISTRTWECTPDGYSQQFAGHRKARDKRCLAHWLWRTVLSDDVVILRHEFSPLPIDGTRNILLWRDVADHHSGCRHVCWHGAGLAGI